MRHIALMIPTIDRIGGAEQQLMSMAEGLAQRGWKVTVIALSGSGGGAAGRLRTLNIEFLSLGMRRGLADPRGWTQLHRWIRGAQPEVVHAHLPHASLLARWSRLGSPVRAAVDTVHSPSCGSLLRRFGYRFTNALPDVVTAVGRPAANPWLSTRAITEFNLQIIPNGVDLNRFYPDDELRNVKRQHLGFSQEFLWIAVGRLDTVKDHATLLRAFHDLPESSRLIIAGEGPLRETLLSLVNELGLHDRVQIPGFQPDIPDLLRAADGFVLCSRWEGLPIALLEAGACGLPAVITEMPGARELLPPWPQPLTSPLGDAGALAESMQRLMDMTASERRERGASAREFVSARFSLDAVLDRWETLYDKVLSANPQPRRFGNPSFSSGKTLRLQ